MNGLEIQQLTNIRTTEFKKPTQIRRHRNILRLSRPEINYLKNKGWTQEQIANFCRVDSRTIRRWLKHDYYYKPKKAGRKPKIPLKNLVSLMIFVFQIDGLTQKNMVVYFRREKGLEVSQQTISRTLKKYDITHKKITYHYANQLRYAEEIKNFKEKMEPLLSTSSVLALDECGFHLNEAPRRGYALKGWRASYRKPGGKGDNYTLILCIQNVNGKGVVHHELIPGGANSKSFHKFLSDLKLPNDEKHHLIMDNLSSHRANQSCIDLGLTPIRELLKSKNIEPVYLPPYSPELNSTELCFNPIRKHIEGQKPRTYEELKLAADEAIISLQGKDFTEYFRHCFQLFDENGILIKQERKKEKQGISNSNRPHFISQIFKIMQKNRSENSISLTEKNDTKNYYIGMKKNLPKSGH